MKLAANRSNLKKHAQTLLGNEYSPEKSKALINVCLNGFERTGNWLHISHDRANHLEKIDTILGNHGVEGFLEGPLDVQYSNAGDSYALTIGYVNGKLYIMDWGSLVESVS